MVQFLFFLILFILIADFILERSLSFLNAKAAAQPIPSLLSDVYTHSQYRKQQLYFQANTRFGMITSAVSLMVVLLMFCTGGFGWLSQLVGGWSENPIIISLIFFGLIFLANELIFIPFEWYQTFVIEDRFGFNKMTPKLFITDKLKGYLLSVVVGGAILTLVMWIYRLNPTYFWLIAWSCITVISLFISFFYSELIVPLFNKQTPLEAGELRDEIEKFAVKSNFKLKNIFVIDGSKRSTKANAYFTGFGKKKRIVLYDTLIRDLTTDEIVAVLAHEVGHNKHNHTLKNILLNMPYTLLMFFLFGIMLQSQTLAQALGGSEASFHLNALGFGFIYSPLAMVIGLGMNILSRRFEYQADAFVKVNGLSNQLISSLKKISSKALSNLTPHPAYVFVHYSHPTLYQRIKALL